MAGSTPSGRRSRRRSSKRPSSALNPSGSRGKRRSNVSRQPKRGSHASQGPLTGNSARSTQETGQACPRRQAPARSPQLSSSVNPQTYPGSTNTNPGSRRPQPSQALRQQQGLNGQRIGSTQNAFQSSVQGQPTAFQVPNPHANNAPISRDLGSSDRPINAQSSYADSVNSFYTTPYPVQMSGTQSQQGQYQLPMQPQGQRSTQAQAKAQVQMPRQPRQYSQGSQYFQGSVEGQAARAPQSPQSAASPRSLRHSSELSNGAGHQSYNQPQSAASVRNPRDIRLGPDMRRRPQLSSNPAFGRTRSTPRSGPGGVMTPPVPQPPYFADAASNTGSQLPPQQLDGALQVGAIETHESRLSNPAQPRTQHLRPRPVARRSGAKRARNKRARARSASPAIVPTSALSLPTSNAPHPRKAVSPLIYGVRLLILGVGLGAIAGTLISALDPSSVSGQTGVDQAPAVVENGDADVGNNSDNGGSNVQAGSSILDPSARQSVPSASIISFNAIPKRSPYTALNSQLQTMANTQPELTPGVFALDLETYDYVDLNGSTTFSAASIIKVPILVAFLQDVEQNKVRLDEILVMEEADVAGGSGNMRLGTIGDQYSALETARKMIVISDNTATNMLIRRLGGIDQLNRRFQSWGLTATALRNPLPDLEGTNTTSPAEMTKLMTIISQGKLLQTQSRDRMLDIMYQTETATLLPAGIGDNAAIAHKTGDIGSMVGDTGVVDTASGKRYAVTIMMRRPHNDSRAQELIRQMAGVIHRELQTPSGTLPVTTSPQTVAPSESSIPTTDDSGREISTTDTSESEADAEGNSEQ